MESFPDQLKRQSRYFSKLSKLSAQYIQKQTQLLKIQNEMARTMDLFAQEEMSYNRAHLKAFSALLQQQATTIALALPQLENFMLCFHCGDEVNLMKSLANAQQKALPPFNKEINAQFVQNAATYQQNRQRQLKQSFINISNFFMAQGAQFIQDAGNMRFQSQQISDAAPIVDVARKFAHLELNVDICKLLNLTKDQFNEFDINGVSIANVEIYRRGSQMPPKTQNKGKPRNSMSGLKSGLEDNKQKQFHESQFETQPVKQQLQKQLNYDNKPQANYNSQPLQQQQSSNNYITNSLVNKFLDDDQPETLQQVPVQKIEQKQPNHKPKPNPLIKQYSFSNSLFDEESDHLDKYAPVKQGSDIDENRPAVQKAIKQEQNLNVDYTQMVSKDLQKQMDEMRQMMSQLTDQPTSTDNCVKPVQKNKLNTVDNSQKMAPKPLVTKSKPEREVQNNEFANQISKAVLQNNENDDIDDFEV